MSSPIKFPSTSPIWGIAMDLQLPDVITRSYIQDDTTDDHVFPIVPSDTVPLADYAGQLMVGTSGTVTVLTESGDTVTLTLVAGGFTILPFKITQVFATGTTATGILGVGGHV